MYEPSPGWYDLCMIIGTIMFCLCMQYLGQIETSKFGNFMGILGMVFAIVAMTIWKWDVINIWIFLSTILAGGVLGLLMAFVVPMTGMPQMVGLLNGFGALAASFLSYAIVLDKNNMDTVLKQDDKSEYYLMKIWTVLTLAIGAFTFVGSVIACLKLNETITGNAIVFPLRKVSYIVFLVLILACIVAFVILKDMMYQLIVFGVLTIVCGVFAGVFVMAIGGADMPVVISVLVMCGGWVGATAGFMIRNNLLLIVGDLVGASGFILSYVMCEAMNRTIFDTMMGGFGGESVMVSTGDQGVAQETTAVETGKLLKAAKSVVIVPGYGLAVARAQGVCKEVVMKLKEKKIQVTFSIHPVAGRLPGHMNVLLAEARVPYDIVKGSDEVNRQMPQTDVVLVIGANDIVNPGAEDDPNSAIYGMPVCQVWLAKKVVVIKRSLASGYAGVANPLFFKENTLMLYASASKALEGILAELNNK